MKKLTSWIGVAALLVCGGVAQASSNQLVDVIVSLKGDQGVSAASVNRANARAVAADHGLSPRFVYGAAFAGFAASVPEARLSRLQADSRVLSISPDGVVQASAPGCNPAKGCGGGGGGGQVLPWGIDRIGATLASSTGAGIDVYVIDTGIDADHADLAAHIGTSYAVQACKGGSCLAAWDDDEGHGTHVSGTIGALDNSIDVVGVAPGVTLHAVKVLNNRGSGSFSGIIAGIDWVASETAALGKATVANMSLGGSGSKTGTCTDAGFTGSDNLHRAMCNAKNVGVVFAVAAGNEYDDAANHVPAAYDDAAIAVSATSAADDWPGFSNWGNAAAAWAPHASAPVAIAAPGASILSTKLGGGTTTLSGTSMASPHVAGALALLLATNPQAADGSAFASARSILLSVSESTAGFLNTSGNPHSEDFLNVSGF